MAIGKKDLSTGATNHMVHSITILASITSILHTHVNLPNGETSLVAHIGTVQISNTLTLHDVLSVNTQFYTHNLTLGDDQNNHSKYPKIVIAFHALSHSSHIIKMILRF